MRAHNLLLIVPLMAACGEPDTKIVALSPDIVVAPGEVDFGSIVKLYSVSTDVQILNTGRGALDIESIELEVAGGYPQGTGTGMPLPTGNKMWAAGRNGTKPSAKASKTWRFFLARPSYMQYSRNK